MLPFTRLVQYGNIIIYDDYLLNLDFTRQLLGDTNVIDYSSKSRIFTKLNTSTANIVHDNTLQCNVMYFDGGVFSTSITPDLQLSTKYFEIDVMYKSTSSSTQVLYGTGYYPDIPNRIPGLSHQIGQFTGQDQFFLDDGVNYQRNLLVGSDTQWQRLVYTRNAAGVDIKRYKNGSLVNEITYSNFPFSDGTSFGLGGYYKTPSQWSFHGYMKYLKIKLL